jgi:hypothetical protein
VAAGIDERAVADADAEHEAARVRLAKGPLRGRHETGSRAQMLAMPLAITIC